MLRTRYSTMLLVAALLCAGCGGNTNTDSSPGDTSSNNPPASPPSSPPPPAGTNYFEWGVEINAPANEPNYPRFGGTTFDCTGTYAHSGSCAMRLAVQGNDGGNQQMGVETGFTVYPFPFVNGQEIYYRWWMRIEPGFDWGTGTAKTKSSRTAIGPIVNGTPTGGQGYTGYVMSYGFLIGECDSHEPDDDCRLANGDANTDGNLYIPFDFRLMSDGQWHEYIVKIKPNTAADCTTGPGGTCDAEFAAWVDGVLVGEYNDFKLHSNGSNNMVEGWGGWMATPYFQLGSPSLGGTIYLDDFSTDSSYNSLIP